MNTRIILQRAWASIRALRVRKSISSRSRGGSHAAGHGSPASYMREAILYRTLGCSPCDSYAYESYTERIMNAARACASVHPAGSGQETDTGLPAGRSK